MAYKRETLCIHGDAKAEHPYGAVTVPIYQSATFTHPGIGETTGYNYTRESNPTRTELENIISSMEGAADSIACSSGMAAIAIAMELFENNAHFVCSEDLYGGSVRLFDNLARNRGMSFSYADTSDICAVEAAIRPETAALYIETPSNPTMQITDIAKMRELAGRYNLKLIVDNTFLSPYFQRPIELGADIVLHSGTKYLGGHNDTLAGFICLAGKEDADRARFVYKTTGSLLPAFDSYMIIRGIKTLSVRLERQQENALRIAEWLKSREEVDKVYYIGLKEHPGYEINLRQASGFGGMISFRLKCADTARKILERVKLIGFAESLGGVESLITYPMLQTHADVPAEIRQRLGIDEYFLRFSAGIENCEDLIEDLRQAMEE